MRRLNSLPQTVATRFQPGQSAHNKVERVKTLCAFCGKEMMLTPWKLSRTKKHFCSEGCRSDGCESQATNRAVALYNTGLKLREVADKLGYTVSTVSSLIYKSKLKRTHPRYGHGRTLLRKALPKSCELCGYSRTINIAHIVPVRDGGKFSIQNCYALCPNCHHLFDHNLLTQNEQEKLKEIYASRCQ
jgi:hypothetical protein